MTDEQSSRKFIMFLDSVLELHDIYNTMTEERFRLYFDTPQLAAASFILNSFT